MNKVLILGGYGNFGKRIARALACQQIPVVIAGRHIEKAHLMAHKILETRPNAEITPIALNAEQELADYLQHSEVSVVINTCGPFQNKGYGVAETCIQSKRHYIDLADGRDFVTGIRRLDERAKEAEVSVISGASTVPALSSAVLDHYKSEFSQIDELVFGISPGQKAERGLATTAGILSYVGKALKPVQGDPCLRYGWQDLYRQKYPGLGYRWMANCDIPDLDLLPEQYGIKKIRFSAGMENSLLHLSLWTLSWLVRAGVPLNLEKHASLLSEATHWFDWLGTDVGGMHMLIKGQTIKGKIHTREWFIVASKGDGTQVPCVPSIILAKKLISANKPSPGARPCLGLIKLQEYLAELKNFSIATHQQTCDPIQDVI